VSNNVLEINFDGVKELKQFFETAPEITTTALRDTVNGAVRFGFAESSRQIRKQVNFSQDYIGSVAQGNRLKVTRYATNENLEGTISAKQRAVSLARFADDRTLGGKNGVTVRVKAGGSARQMATAFLVKLQAGNAGVTQDNFNIGLAIRLKKGEKLGNKIKAVPYSKGDPNLYLLYGPSVDQVFNTVRDDVTPAITDYMATEFYRQFERQTR
jgi:hypothetical protein